MINPGMDKAGRKGVMINLSAKLLTPAVQGCEQFNLFLCALAFFLIVNILKSVFESLEQQFQMCFGCKMQFERAEARVQLCLY